MTFNFKGKHHTEKAKKKISQNNGKFWLGKKRPEIGKKISNKLKGMPKSEKHKLSISKVRLGKPTNKKRGRIYPTIWKKYNLSIIDETIWSYIAGIIDGEGTLSLCSSKNGKAKIPSIQISNTDLDLLKWIQSQIKDCKIAIHIYNRNRSIVSKKKCYTLGIYRRKVVLSILLNLLPYLRVKRKKAIEIISYLENS